MKETSCKDCGLIISIEEFDMTHQYSCPRCHSVFYRPGESFDLVLVMALSAFLFFIPTLFLPIMTLTIMGQSHSVTLLEAVLFFFHDGYYVIAIIASSVGVFIPLLMLFLIMMLIIPAKVGRPISRLKSLFRYYEHLAPWSMAEVYLISIFVAIVKLAGMATLKLDAGLVLFVFFLLSYYVTVTWFNAEDLWNHYDEMED